MRRLSIAALLLLCLSPAGCNSGSGSIFGLGEKHLAVPEAQAAVNAAMTGAAQEFHFAKGYQATVQGVQENLPANVATADLAFQSTHFHCRINIFVNFEQRWIRGQAQFKRYSDGRWVLTDITPTQQADSMDCIGHWQGSVDVTAASHAGRITAINGNSVN